MTESAFFAEMLNRLDAIVRAPNGHTVGVLGLGASGKAMALFLARLGAKVVGADAKQELASAAELSAAGVQLRLGPLDARTFFDCEAVCVSPGVDPRQAAVKAVVSRGAPLLGELELVAPHLKARTIGITGTNGKSTTTGLTGALLEAVGKRTFIGGNFGEPVAAFLNRGGEADAAVIELSSFQLETVYNFHVDVAVELNVTPDHLDRYASIEAYANAKQRLVETLEPQGVAVLSYDDPYVREMAQTTRANVWWFSTRSQTIPGDGAFLRGDTMVTQGAASDLGEIDLAHPRLLGRHNRENALAAILSARALGVRDRDALVRGYRAFQGLEHRLELCGEVKGVRYINDSKATNDDAAAIALTAMDRSVVLLLGGRSKNGGYNGLLKAAPGKVRVVIAYGEARDEIAQAFAQHPGLVVTNTIREAFDHAAKVAQSGEAVLLSPACSSYDAFKDYIERGRTFKRWVAELAQ